jgi:hypothetical protein
MKLFYSLIVVMHNALLVDKIYFVSMQATREYSISRIAYSGVSQSAPYEKGKNP